MNIDRLMIIPQVDDLEKYVRLCGEYGCGFEYNDFFIPQVLDDSDETDRRIELYTRAENKPAFSTLHGAFLDISVFSDDPKIREVAELRVNQSLQAARRLGVQAVIFHTNYIPNFRQEAYRQNWVSQNAAYWSQKLKEYPELNIYIENMFDMDCTLLARLGEQMKEYSNFGICLDYAHAHVFGNEEDMEVWVKTLAPYVKHLHINDNDFITDMHLAVGDGKIDWQRFKAYYEQYLSHASVLLEVTGIEKTIQSLKAVSQI